MAGDPRKLAKVDEVDAKLRIIDLPQGVPGISKRRMCRYRSVMNLAEKRFSRKPEVSQDPKQIDGNQTYA